MSHHIGEKIKRARTEKGMTQKSLSELLTCTEIMISRYELGVSQISLHQLKKISMALGKPMSYFFDEQIGDSTQDTSSQSHFKKAFVFDLDETLVDGRQFCGETIARVITNKFPSVNFDYVCAIHDSIRGQSIADLYAETLKRLDLRADIEELVRHDQVIQSESIGRMKLFDGVVDILEFLKISGKKVYICTNRTKPLLVKILKANKIMPYFDEIISCVDAGYKKPNPYCLIDLVQRSGIEKKHFIYFGDSVVDSEFAQNAEIEHIIFDQYLNNKNVFKKLVNMFLEQQIVGGDL